MWFQHEIDDEFDYSIHNLRTYHGIMCQPDRQDYLTLAKVWTNRQADAIGFGSLKGVHLTRAQEHNMLRLRNKGYTIGYRNPLINTAFCGKYMVAALDGWDGRPTESARGLRFAVVGDNIGELIERAYNFEFG